MNVKISDSMTDEIDELNAEREKTRKPYIRVTYELSGTWMVLGLLEEYAKDPSDLGRVLSELAQEAWDEWPEEPDRLLVEVITMTDYENARLPEFPGW